MAHYYFTHQSDPTEKYLAVEDGTQVRVSWDESMGHSGRNSRGNNVYDATVAANYLKGGLWILCEEEPLKIKTLDEIMPEAREEAAKLFADLVPAGESVDVSSSHGLGTFRPVLETRKVGKVRVELVDDGFPLALREIAKVMTWAQTAKGYKDHDWLNLPAAEIQLAAAASRHRTDHIVQRLIEDKPALECVDPESALMHKAHEAFGVLAQLEYMLRNKPE